MKFKELYTELNESLYANENKLYKLIQLRLGKDKKLSDYQVENTDAPSEMLFIRTSILKIIPVKEFKEICKNAGYYASVHYSPRGVPLPFDPIYITPINQRSTLKMTNGTYYHCSKVKTLDITGLRLKSRLVDNDFDIYENRIYLIPEDKCKPDELLEMVADEHGVETSDLSLYKIELPINYDIYQDPTKFDAVYITSSIPAQFVEKIR